jgi:cytochrome o ubiquinol oxidase subunit 2
MVIPVLFLTFFFAYKYRASNTKAKYTPNWEHNHLLELIWWTIPIVIITVLGVITWKSTHDLDPYRPLEHPTTPLEIEVVALDWKWLFIYPKENIAVVNELRIPINVPIKFKITAEAPMNSFWIPRLGGQIYAMEGMQTELHLLADQLGTYEGFSSNFSGRGFYGMKFLTKAESSQEFTAWVEKVKGSGSRLDFERYKALALPSENNEVSTFAEVEKDLFLHIMFQYMMMTTPNSYEHNQSEDGHHH